MSAPDFLNLPSGSFDPSAANDAGASAMNSPTNQSRAVAAADPSQAPAAGGVNPAPEAATQEGAVGDIAGTLSSAAGADQPVQAKTGLFRSIVLGALSGVANHLKGAGEGLAERGIPGMIEGAADPNRAQQVYDQNLQARTARTQQTQATAQRAEDLTQFGEDEHGVRMGLMHMDLLNQQRAYGLVPKTIQDVFDQQEEKFAEQPKLQGAEVVQGGIDNFPDAQLLAQKRNEINPNSQFSYVPLRDTDGTWQVLNVPSPNEPTRVDAEVPVFTSSGVQYVKVPAGSMSKAQLAQTFVSNVGKGAQAMAIQEAKDQTAQGVANIKANAQRDLAATKAATAGAKVDNMLVGSMPDGSQVAGTQADLQAAGATGVTKLPAAEASKVVVARQLVAPDGLFHLVANDLAQLQQQGKLNVATSRWNEFMAGKVGAGDPAYTALRTHTQLLSTALMQAHVGSRGSENMMDHFKNLADAGKMDAPTLTAALQAEFHYVREKAMLPRKKGGQ